MNIEIVEGDKTWEFTPYYNNAPLEEFCVEASRPIYLLEENGETFLVKFDSNYAYRNDYDPTTYHQSSFEYDTFFNQIAESDKWAFLELVGGKMIEQGECGRGYVIQPYVPDIDDSPIPENWQEALEEITSTYGIDDVDWPNENCGYLESEGRPVIYDWGFNDRG